MSTAKMIAGSYWTGIVLIARVRYSYPGRETRNWFSDSNIVASRCRGYSGAWP